MITVKPQKNLESAKIYFRKHLAQGDYYSQGNVIPGYWFGKGVARLGLDASVPAIEEHYLRLCENLHPLTKEKLTVRQRKANRRVTYDFAVSAPKSVSIMALTAGDARIVTAHDEAARIAMTAMERVAAARIRKGGQRSERTTGEMVAVVFRHDASRALDPQLHTHYVTLNCTYDATEQRWKALESSQMFAQIHLFTEVYRSELALRLRGFGYDLRHTANGFEIEGVSPELIERFSKRRQSILAEEAKLTAKLGKPLTNNARAILAHANRERKDEDLDPATVLAQQHAQLSPSELDHLHQLIQPTPAPVIPPAVPVDVVKSAPAIRPDVEQPDVDPNTVGVQQPVQVSPAHLPPLQLSTPLTPVKPTDATLALAAIEYARQHLFERRSVVPEHELLATALSYARGCVTLDAIQAALNGQPDLIRAEGALTTTQALREEKRMITLVNQSLGHCRPFIPRFTGATTLSEEQRHCVSTVLGSRDGIVCLRGGAGTGKTFTLKEIVQGIEAAGHTVVTLAPSACAVEVLRKEGFGDAQTVQTLLAAAPEPAQLKGKTVLVDEAGLLSGRQMLALVEVTQKAGARLILSGDVRQHGSVEAGDALRVLEQYSGAQTVELRNIRRQTDAEYRQAISEIAAGQPARAFVRLDRMDAIQEVETDTRYAKLAADYVTSVAAGKSALVIAPTRREGEQVTAEIRQRLQNDGHLKTKAAMVEAHLPLQWTEAQKRDLRNYQPGQVLLFHRGTRDFAKGEWGKVAEVSPDALTVRKRNGTTAQITRKQSGAFEVAKAEVLKIASGEQLLIQGNRQSDGLLNGQIVTVKRVQRDGSLALADGRTVPADFRCFNYGYCITSPKSQGKTVDHVYLAVDSGSGLAANQKQFYVSASRGRERIKIYTDDREWLRDQVMKPGTRPAALELAEAAAASLNPLEHIAGPRAAGAKHSIRP